MSKFFSVLMGATLFALIFVSAAGAQIRRGNERVPDISRADAAELWQKFRAVKIAGDYAMAFKIEHAPRKSESSEYVGEILGAVRGDSTLSRIRIKRLGSDVSAEISDYILKNSPKVAKVWRAINGKYVEVPEADWFKPLHEALVYSPFDLLMPYVNWNADYAGAGRAGQAVYFFDALAPEKFSKNISKTRVALTREFNSPAQTQVFGADGKCLKTVSLGSVKKVDGLWIMLEASARDDLSRDKDVLRFFGARLNAVLDDSIFDPSKPVSIPPKQELKRL